MIKKIKEWLWPSMPEVKPVVYACKKHGVNVGTLGFMMRGKITRICLQCLAESFPVEEVSNV